MITDEGDGDSKEFDEIYEIGQDSELTRLTEMVRKHYLNYLEKQLLENLLNSTYNSKKNGIQKDDNDLCTNSIKKTAELLEDKAVKACMVAKFYQRAMVKIIAVVRRTTEEKRLVTPLERCIQTKDDPKPITCSKETQTVEGRKDDFLYCNQSLNYTQKFTRRRSLNIEDDKNIISLDEKIEMFQKRLQKDKFVDVANKYPSINNQHRSKRHQKYNRSEQISHIHNKERQTNKQEVYFSSTSSTPTAPTTPISPGPKPQNVEPSLEEHKESHVGENENSNDSVGLELARLFSEEKTELDEIFGIDPNDEPDDPQICKILKEIEEAKVIGATTSKNPITETKIENPQTEKLPQPQNVHEQQSIDFSLSIDLRKSIWPCELFMQRRKLSESLARLLDEDLRWHEIIKWKFIELFGEDSDDEFTPCSPSIELNEALIGSCARRISPWVVKYLMKPMRDGLIGNRFLFKKLAKNLARNIIMENQYPDEAFIKECIENFFCLHQTVMSLDDLDVNIQSISSSF